MPARQHMTLQQALLTSTEFLRKTGIETARLDCLVLLEDLLNTNRAQILAHPEKELTTEQEKILASWIKRRAAHEPLAYIRNKTEFYNREFYINHHVLEPRPESETMIDMLMALPSQPNTIIVDIGTGSGALAITAKLELPNTPVFAIDIDHECLNVAQKNAKLLNASINFLHGDLLEPLRFEPKNSLVLLCNLPYVPDDFHINPAAMREPKLAIFGGPDGLDIYRSLFNQLSHSSNVSVTILAEALPLQHNALTSIAHGVGFSLQRTEDFIQLFRKGSDNSAS